MTRAIFSWKDPQDASKQSSGRRWEGRGRRSPPWFATHPLFGGTMHNKVVYQTRSRLMRSAFLFCDQFSGAGLSGGEHDRGRGEQDDVRAALDFLSGEFSSVPLLVRALVWLRRGLRAGCEDSRVSQLIGLGLPWNNTDVSFLSHCNKPKLFVHGSDDEYGAIEKVKTLVAPCRVKTT